MAQKLEGIRQAVGRIDTLIGADVRIDGSISFRGVLRTEGRVFGNIAGAERAAAGTVVIGRSGSVVGNIEAGGVIVGGRVEGDLHVGDSAEVLEGAHVVGDVCYGRIRVAAGGTIEGTLQPDGGMAAGRSANAAADVAPPRLAARAVAGNPDRPGGRTAGGARWVAGFAVLLAGTGALVMAVKGPASTDAAIVTERATREPVAPAETSAQAPEPAKEVAAAAATPDIAPAAPAAAPAVAALPQNPAPSADQVTIVQGDQADKSADFVFVVGNEACVLSKKKLDQPGDGKRIELGDGARKRIPVGADDLLRVAEGQDVDMFYQGHKVPVATLRSGVWLRFVAYGGGR